MLDDPAYMNTDPSYINTLESRCARIRDQASQFQDQIAQRKNWVYPPSVAENLVRVLPVIDATLERAIRIGTIYEPSRFERVSAFDALRKNRELVLKARADLAELKKLKRSIHRS